MAHPARLTAALLAPNGHALPTGGFAHSGLDRLPPRTSTSKSDRQPWAAPTPPEPQPERSRPAPRRSTDDAGADRIAFTLRLDRDRHARLRVLAARRGRSGQEMLIKALDAYLDACATDCPCLRRDDQRREDN